LEDSTYHPAVDLPPAASLADHVRRFLAAPRIATIATSGGDGEPHQTVAWYRLEPDDRILLNSRSPRRWPAELLESRRCAIAVIDEADPYHWVGIQGVVESVNDDVPSAREDIVALAYHYGHVVPEDIALYRTQERISFLIRIVRVHDHLGD
jgi:hypothetical protein